MKPFDMQTGMDVNCEAPIGAPIERILKRQSERKKEDKPGVEHSTFDEIEQFIENFNEKQSEIEESFEQSESISRDLLPSHFNDVNNMILNLQKLYSNSTFFLRIYDKKICQKSIHTLQDKFQEIEGKLLPKKKFGFKARKNKIEIVDVKNGDSHVDGLLKLKKVILGEICGFRDRSNEDLVLENEDIEKKDILLSNLRKCSVRLLGAPSTLHIANVESCTLYCGPVATSIFIENVKNCNLQLACQQLRIHSTFDCNFYIHVTSKAIIEDSKDVRFGVYKFNYDNIEKHYEISGLNKDVNNWDLVDDFNWLVSDKPSPNWSKLSEKDVLLIPLT